MVNRHQAEFAVLCGVVVWAAAGLVFAALDGVGFLEGLLISASIVVAAVSVTGLIFGGLRLLVWAWGLYDKLGVKE